MPFQHATPVYVDEFLEQKRATPTVDPVMQRAERAMDILDDFLEKSATKSPKVLLCSAMPARLPLSSSSALQELCTAFGCIPLTHDANVTPPQLYQSCALRLGASRLCILMRHRALADRVRATNDPAYAYHRTHPAYAYMYSSLVARTRSASAR